MQTRRRLVSVDDNVAESRTKRMEGASADDYPFPLKKRMPRAPMIDDDAMTIIERQPVDQRLTPPHDIPHSVNSIIDNVRGTGVVRIMQKMLSATDVNYSKQRLLIPFNKISYDTLFTNQEKHYMSQMISINGCASIETQLIDPTLNTHEILLKRCLITKKSGRKYDSYFLRKPWNDIVRSNRLMKGHVIQLWGFRVGKQLRMVLLKL